MVGCGGKTVSTGVSGGACGFLTAGAGIFLVSKSLGLLAQPPMISFATKLGELRDWTTDDEKLYTELFGLLDLAFFPPLSVMSEPQV